jgi:micrococcal nuclease
VTRVVDGDTITIRGDTGLVKVRLIGVDTLETVHPWKAVQYYGKEASRFTINLLKGEKVYLTYEGDKPTRDKYGRVLTYVYRAPDGLFVNAEIIRQGYGHAYVRFPIQTD